MIKIHVKEIARISEREEEKIIVTLSASAKGRLSEKRNEELRLASLCALSTLSDEERGDLEYTASGRPFFANLDADVSIAHSKTHVAVALSSSRAIPVGIDAEDTRGAAGASRFLTESEAKELENGASFIEIWTKKEALFKFLKDDSKTLIKLDSTTPKAYGASFFTARKGDCVITVCHPEGEEIEIV